jgi:hypothetical protein
MEQWYGNEVVMRLRKTLYGLKQSAYRFWIYLLTVIETLNCKRSKADPCLYYQWIKTGALLLWISWVDDCFITGPTAELMRLKGDIMSQVECDDGGEVNEFIGCKIDHNKELHKLKLTQPVLLQSFSDEFQMTGGQ